MASTEWYELLNNGSVTGDEADSLKSTATTGVMQITGPAAATIRVATIPDSDFTVARTDAAQTFTGAQTYTSPIVFDANTGITAFATGGQASATALTGQFNNVTTCATAGDSVKLAAAVAGSVMTVKNSGAAACAVFPASGDAINALAANLSVDIAPGGQMTFRAIDGTTWETEEFLTSQAPSTQKGSLVVKAVDNDGNTVTTLSNAAMGQATVISFPDPGAATANVVLTSATNDGTVVAATAAELDYNNIATLGTLEASKTWTSDASLDTVMPTGGLLTVQSGGAITLDSGSTLTNNAATVATAQSAEHGAGAIGTAATPKTYRWTDRGVIITQTTFDLTGLASVATANDVIGLAAGGAAYIGRNVVATNGVIFKVELSCLETPTTGDNDVNVVANASATLAYDDAGGTTYLSNSGDLLIGQTIQNLLPGLTEGDYYYLTAGTGDTAGTYASGMYVLTTYGHAVLA